MITILTAGAVIALWWPATAGLTGADLVKARLDALKIGLSIGVGGGGVVALYLAWRRQHSTEADLDNRERTLAHQQAVAATAQAHQERVADDARADAIERRITELYLKAVEQLGSDKAPVRLGGFYALERLAQDNETQRQTIANVLCAYLRMPYVPPVEQDRKDDGTEHSEVYRERAQEREVRLTAQRLLSDHLAPDRGDVYWGELDLDLTGAQLINFTLTHVRIGTGTFHKATFIGDAEFLKATFVGDAEFAGATFIGDAGFSKAAFTSGAQFGQATFTKIAEFHKATFNGTVSFMGTTFASPTLFTQAAFARSVYFDGATFTSGANFAAVVSNDEVSFNRVTFIGYAIFTEAAFTSARFAGVAFNGGVECDRATVDDRPLANPLPPHNRNDSGEAG
ncbi:hypothetical protein BS329_40190 [Amycolatopsis coloradensis]|uniref:Pentapeptide repeat-containing protein n=1 Tax=Amycolatopsis coloradensis TaxID=76021 RepID=A0A1R0KDR2_9PSEU|nr:hypothetical protein BS329_40190 [Amycolatopsis coloradensis]